MRKLLDGSEALENLSGLKEVSLRLSQFKPNSDLKGEPFYTLMEHHNGMMTGKYYTIPARGDSHAILLFESNEKAFYFRQTREDDSSIKKRFYIRGISGEHLKVLVDFMELAFLYAAFIGNDFSKSSKVLDLHSTRVRFITPSQLLTVAGKRDSILFQVFKRLFWHFNKHLPE